MSTKRPTITSVKFLKEGIRVVYDDGQEIQVGDPINVTALGTGIQDGAAYTVIKFKDRDARWRTAAVRSSLLTAKTNEFTAELTDRHYRWPNRKYVSFVIDELAAKNPKKRIAITMVPGWHGSRYVHPHEVIKRDGDDWECLLADNPNVRLGEFISRGTLEEWKNGVARYCHLSSRLCLAVGAPFTAPILRRVHLDTFGIHFVGGTSSGKTLCLRVGGSVPGFNSEAGPTSWDGTHTGFEQLALGTRDNLMSMDDTDAIEGDPKKKAEFVKLSIFKLSKNQQKLRAGHYARANSVNSDSRNIIMSSGEDVLIEGRRVRGQDVRLIHMPAEISDLQDIFDADNASNTVGETVGEREHFVSEFEQRTREFQGVAQLAFLRRLINDKTATAS
jgi:putative DNA primase/helicase